jgi:hypothetical protein
MALHAGSWQAPSRRELSLVGREFDTGNAVSQELPRNAGSARALALPAVAIHQ